MVTSQMLQSGGTVAAISHCGQLKIGFILARSFTLSAFALFVDTLRLASDTDDKSGRLFADWQVISKGWALMGGFDDNSRSEPNATKRLVVRGLALMGGVEIKNREQK